MIGSLSAFHWYALSFEMTYVEKVLVSRAIGIYAVSLLFVFPEHFFVLARSQCKRALSMVGS